jgi:hypothetical protein
MDSDRNHSSIDGGQPAERQPLLPSPLSTNGHPDRITADSTETSNTLLDSRMKLGASALNFFLSGIAMAAVGVGITAHACSLDAR